MRIPGESPQDVKIHYFKEDGRLVFYVGDFEVTSCSVENFSTVYSNVFRGLKAEVLPPAIRFLRKTGNGFIMLFETPPQYHQVQFTPDYLDKLELDGKSKYTFMLPFPWLRYVVYLSPNFDIDKILGFMSKQPFAESSMSKKPVPIPVNNWYAEGHLCRPVYTNDPYVGADKSLFGIVNQVLTEVWDSGFNTDLDLTIKNYWALTQNRPSDLPRTLATGAKINSRSVSLGFYQHWQRLTIPEMMTFYHPSNLTISYSNLLPSEAAKALPMSQLKTKILSAAQDASMLEMA